VTDQLHGGSLFARALADYRRVIVPLAIAFVVNLLVYVFAVYPLTQRVANVEQRNQSAEQALAVATREHDAAQGALTGKERASVELATFYTEVLPPDLAGARRLTYLRLAQLVREAGLEFKTGAYQMATDDRDSTLQRWKIGLKVQGSWDDIRTLIYQLDTAPEFVVIDNIVLNEGQTEGAALELSLELSTYYQAGGDQSDREVP
jgi:Tfp pilus assembly protein PilO